MCLESESPPEPLAQGNISTVPEVYTSGHGFPGWIDEAFETTDSNASWSLILGSRRTGTMFHAVVLWYRLAVASFVCQDCGKSFELSEAMLSKYPGWQPKRCLICRKTAKNPGKSEPRSGRHLVAPARRAAPRSSSREENLTVAEVLAKYTAGPRDGVFTDGAAEPNPGPGGWGAVYVINNEIVGERWGSEPHTTNNRMELQALLAGCVLVPEGTQATLYTDSQLCVSTITEWAKGWKARGWKRKGGAIKNLELVQELFAVFERRPELELKWIAAHAGNRWNEYADSLATSYRRTKR